MNIEEIDAARSEIGHVARQILDGKLSFIEGSRVLWRLGRRANLPERDSDLTIFLAIDSETDALPVGKERELWAIEALDRLQPEIEHAEAWAKDFGFIACENLVKRFGNQPV